MTIVDRTVSRAEARRHLALLRAAGIAATLENTSAAGFEISVDPANVHEAMAVLERARAEPGLEIVWICPRCQEENASTFETCWRCTQSLDGAVAREVDPALPVPEVETRLGASDVRASRRALELAVLLAWFVGWARVSLHLDPGDPLTAMQILYWVPVDMVALAALLGIAAGDRAAFPRGRGGPGGWAVAGGAGIILGFAMLAVTEFAYFTATREGPDVVLFPEPEFATPVARTVWLVRGYFGDILWGLFFVRFVCERVRSFAPLAVAIAASCLLQVAAHAKTMPEAVYLLWSMVVPAVVYAFLRDPRPIIVSAWVTRTIWWLSVS